MSSEWTWYIVGAASTLVYKWGRYCYVAQKKDGKTIRASTAEWFFTPSQENIVSWSATVGAVWFLGSLYIDRTIHVTGLTDLPVMDSLALILGSLMEFTVPAICKWIMSKIPGGQ